MLSIVGIGGAGCNIVDYFYRKDVVSTIIGKIAGKPVKEEIFVSGVAIDTSDKIMNLKNIPQGNSLLIGKSKGGHGAGKDVALGRKIMKEEMELVINAIKKVRIGKPEILFLAAGLGGGTGTGGFDVISKSIKKACKVPIIGIIILPARGEGKVLNKNAFSNLNRILESVDGAIVLDNNVPCNMGENILGAHKIINKTLRNFFLMMEPSVMEYLLNKVSTIGYMKSRSRQLSLRDVLREMLREKVYLDVKMDEVEKIFLVVRGNLKRVYGQDFVKSWTQENYGTEVDFILRDSPNKYTNIGLIINGIKDLSSRFKEIRPEAKEEKISELDELLGDISPLY